jgi:hypothetical protein
MSLRNVCKLLHYIVVYRPVAKRRLCKQQPLLANDRNIHARSNKTTGLCNSILSNGSVRAHVPAETNMRAAIENRCFLLGPPRGYLAGTPGWLSEVNWIEVKWSGVKWSEVKWSEVKWSEVKWSEVVGWRVREFSFIVVNWNWACEEKTRRLVWNGRQPGNQSAVQLSEMKWSSWLVSEWVRLRVGSWVELCKRG